MVMNSFLRCINFFLKNRPLSYHHIKTCDDSVTVHRKVVFLLFNYETLNNPKVLGVFSPLARAPVHQQVAAGQLVEQGPSSNQTSGSHTARTSWRRLVDMEQHVAESLYHRWD